MILPANCELRIRSDEEFYVRDAVYGLIGPDHSTDRYFVVKAVDHEREIFVRGATTGELLSGEIVELPNPVEDLDPVPMEVPLALQEPETMREIISRYVQEENMRIASRQDINYVESEDEADDFDVEDDAQEFISEEEFRQMQEDNEKDLTGSKDSGIVESPTAEVKDGNASGKARKEDRPERGRSVQTGSGLESGDGSQSNNSAAGEE